MKQKLSSFQKITCITAIADKKNKVYSVCLGVLRAPFQSAVQIKYLFSSAWLSFLQEFTTQEKSLSTIIFELSGLKM